MSTHLQSHLFKLGLAREGYLCRLQGADLERFDAWSSVGQAEITDFARRHAALATDTQLSAEARAAHLGALRAEAETRLRTWRTQRPAEVAQALTTERRKVLGRSLRDVKPPADVLEHAKHAEIRSYVRSLAAPQRRAFLAQAIEADQAAVLAAVLHDPLAGSGEPLVEADFLEAAITRVEEGKLRQADKQGGALATARAHAEAVEMVVTAVTGALEALGPPAEGAAA